jgi:hypothetical protein
VITNALVSSAVGMTTLLASVYVVSQMFGLG